MSLSALERRELLAIADTFEACQHSPDMIARFADMLRVWTVGKDRRSGSTPGRQEQLELDSEPVESSTCVDSARIFEAPSRVTNDPSRTYPMDSDSSSSADLDLPKEKMQRGSFTLDREEPCTPELAKVAAEVIAMRSPLKLPSAEYMWGKFCDMVVDEERTFARRWNIKRAFRQFCEREWELKEGTSTPPPPPPESTRRPIVSTSPAAAKPRPRPAARADAGLLSVLAVGASAMASRGAIRAPPEPRSASA